MINNIYDESKRKSKKTQYSYDQEKNKGVDDSYQYIENEVDYSYYSVFYGNLTKTWIKIRN